MIEKKNAPSETEHPEPWEGTAGHEMLDPVFGTALSNG